MLCWGSAACLNEPPHRRSATAAADRTVRRAAQHRAGDGHPFCSLRISLQSQGLFINDFVARSSMQELYRLFTRGTIAFHGAFVNALIL